MTATEERRRIELEDGRKIVMRRPTEAEMVSYLQKRMQLAFRKPVDRMDDGGEEVIACVTAPDAEVLEEILEDFPALERDLAQAFRELGGDLVEPAEPASPEEAAAWLAEVPAETREKYSRLLCLRAEGQLLALRRLSRLEFKFWDQDTPLEQRFASLAKLGRDHLVHGAPAWEACPALAVKLGAALLDAARAKVKAQAGK